MNVYGLIGFPLTHSFSKKYFSEKFVKENIPNSLYELFELKNIADLNAVLTNNTNLRGLNVTIPYKEAVLPFLDEIDPAAKKIGAVNVIRITNGKLKGYNSDYYGFKWSLEQFIGINRPKALILGTGGAAKAVKAVFDDLLISYTTVSRTKSETTISYNELNNEVFEEYKLIINTTPVGMYPNLDAYPPIPMDLINETHFLFDLVYNPPITKWMEIGAKQGAKTLNGLEMLHGQAEKAWEIWNS